NLNKVRARIQAAEQEYGRENGAVTLIAVSKTKPVELLREAIEAGQQVFGESYLQEALDKQQTLSDQALEWHFIGPIQSNKTRPLAENFDWVHSVDRLKIAQRLNDQRPADKPVLNVMLQVNISGEDSKAGVTVNELKTLVESVIQLPRLKLRGLMAIPLRTEDFSEQRRVFRQLAELKTQLNADYGLNMDCLSMGMSGDLEAAIAEGATHVRIGTDIFGAREYK
ncbi:MAG: YggS family pyridoxal phosphate-dependent enzyme, partial [Gammaproteobacteria bacterium]|nr:YggS family pyridoxal phosphate-dependent enzyme [Gammaproteobacteria bacterium]